LIKGASSARKEVPELKAVNERFKQILGRDSSVTHLQDVGMIA
jgi:hypothetical protein